MRRDLHAGGWVALAVLTVWGVVRAVEEAARIYIVRACR